MTSHRLTILSTALVASALAAGAASAADVVVNAPAGARSLTAAEINAARPFVNPLPAPAGAAAARAELAPANLVPGASGAAATATGPRAFGSFGIPYSTERVQAGPSSLTSAVGPRYLSTTFPYRAIGRVTFTTPSGGAYCSASVIRRGIIVTAAHCIQNFGSGNTNFTNYVFSPSYYAPGVNLAQQAPYGQWTWRGLIRPATWANGTDPGTGAARANDLALIALNKNGGGQFIGDVVGKLGYSWNNYSFVSSVKTGNLSVAETATLGYPGLIDAGGILQRANGPSYLTTVGAAPQIWQGNNFTGGSSGGPWIVNFRYQAAALSGGAVIGAQSNLAVIGVTSWGSADPNAPKDNYSSRFAQNTVYPAANYGGYGAGNIAALLQTLCNSQNGLGQTYAAGGWCQ